MDTVHIEESSVFCHNVNFSLVKRIPQNIYIICLLFLTIYLPFFHMVLVSYVPFVFITNPLQSLKRGCSKILLMSFGYKNAKMLLAMRAWSEIGFSLYSHGVPFIAFVYLNFRKLYICITKLLLFDEQEKKIWCWCFALSSCIFPQYKIFYVLPNWLYSIKNVPMVIVSFFNCVLIVVWILFAYLMFSPSVFRLLLHLRKYGSYSTDV